MNSGLLQQEFDRLRVSEPNEIQVHDGADLLGDFYIRSGVINEDAGIDEVRLTFNLTALQTGD